MNNKKLQVAVEAALENWDQEVSGYAHICEAGLQAMLDTEFDQAEIDAHIDDGERGYCLYDKLQLCRWAHELGRQVLDNSTVFVYDTLDVSEHEAKLRYNNEMSEFEQELFATLYNESCEELTWEEVLTGNT